VLLSVGVEVDVAVTPEVRKKKTSLSHYTPAYTNHKIVNVVILATGLV
jgi:hypothetical protein